MTAQRLVAFLLVASLSAPLEAQVALVKEPAPTGQLIDVGGYRVHVACYGAGTPTVLILGSGASFEWGLVTPAIARRTRVCAYDHSGTAWSDDGPPDSCELRVQEIVAALKVAKIDGPFVVVGHSIGALVARLFAARYPEQTAGLVIVDHATDSPVRNVSLPDASATRPPDAVAPGSPVLGKRTPIGESAFAKLPASDFALHQWAASRPRDVASRQRSPAILSQCSADIDRHTTGSLTPLGDRPVAVLHVNSGETISATSGTSSYAKLQQRLASLSRRSRLVQVERSSHYMMLDRPDVVIDAVLTTVEAAKQRAPGR